ncbi:hypothetical protein Patl1_28124 [Pistacia atlantica]|uniref:Uncharacterized protein n=1 Tax=Pistacia atlantica TaxID=434234 RepID=A0ACC1BGS1_9ROSI|nr:hypothetical protein Patl1_28124 [Pistacia atlantica]
MRVKGRDKSVAMELKKGEALFDGILGVFGKVNYVDIKGSEAFLQTFFFERINNVARTQHLVALDCGFGIRRITKNLLIRYFKEVKLIFSPYILV